MFSCILNWKRGISETALERCAFPEVEHLENPCLKNSRLERLSVFFAFVFYSHAGPLSVAIPGELKAYWAAHQKHGKLPWSDLVQPTIDLCKNGFPVGKHLEDKIQGKRSQLLNEPSLR